MTQSDSTCECGSRCDCVPTRPARWKMLLALCVLLAALAVGAFKLAHLEWHSQPKPLAGKNQPAAEASKSAPAQDCSKDCGKSTQSCCGESASK